MMENGEDSRKVEERNDSPSSEVKNDKTMEDKPAEEPTTQEPSAELLKKIKNQIEFYFGNVNMQRDKFLIEQTKLDEGWIPMTVMLNFKMLSSMSKDVEVILRAIEDSELMEISQDRKKIRRSLAHPLPVFNEEYRKSQEARTIYVKGFPLTDVTIEKLKGFLEPFEPFENIIMRKYLDKEKKYQFKGSIFVQFKTLEAAKAFMEKDSIKYNDTELIRKWSTDYYVQKEKEKEERKQKKSEKKSKKTDEKQDDAADGEDNEEAKKDKGLPKGSVIHFSGVSEDCTREDIKDRLGVLNATVAFVDFKKGDKEGWVRLQGEHAAQPVVDQMKDGTITINESIVTCRILEGDEEETYLTKAQKDKANLRHKHSNKGKRGGRKGRGGFAGRKRRNSSAQDSVAPKKIAAD